MDKVEPAGMSAETTRARRNIYHALSAGFYVPEADILSPQFIQDLQENFAALDALDELGDSLNQLNKAGKQYDSLEKLLVEYSKLFLGPDKLLAPPYGSYYLNDKTTMGASTTEVIKIYEKLDLELSDSFQDLPDHISLELYFLAYLVEQQLVLQQEKGSAAGRNVLKWQNYFLENYLYPWQDEFTDKIKSNYDSDFYSPLADIYSCFIDREIEYLARNVGADSEV